VAEMLVQSNRGEVSVLPALPDAWATGSFDGLRGEGGLTLGATWREGVATELRVTPDASGEIAVRSPLFSGPFVAVDSAGATIEVAAEEGVGSWAGEAGETYTVVPELTASLTGPSELVQGETGEYTVTVAGDIEDLDAELVLDAPDGWVVSPLCTAVEGAGVYHFQVTAPAEATGGTLTAVLDAGEWQVRDSRVVTVNPAPPANLIDQDELTVPASSEQLQIEHTPVANMV